MINRFPSEIQFDMMDCGPTCIKIVAKYYGKFYPLHFLREKCGTTREGVSMIDLRYTAEDIGFRSRTVRCSYDDLLLKVSLPGIIHWEENHFLVVYKVKERKIYLSDPSRGLLCITKQEFEEKWLKDKGSDKEKKGVIMVLEPMADFKDRHRGEAKKKTKEFSALLKYFSPYKKDFSHLLVVMTIVTALQAMIPFISRSIIDVGIRSNDMNFIDLIVIANIVILISIMLSNAVRDWLLQHLASRINVALISDYLIKLLKLPINFFENKLMGDILQRAQDHERIRSFIMNNSLNMFFSTLTFITFSIILLIFNKFIFYAFLGGSVIYLLWVFSFMKLRKKLDWNYFELAAKDQSIWVETITSIYDIKANNYEKAKRGKWEDIQARLYKTNLRMQTISNMQNLGSNFIDGLKNLFITYLCAKAVIAGEMSFGVMISTQMIIGMLNAPVSQFVQFIISLQVAKISFLRLNEITSMDDETDTNAENNLLLPTNKKIVLNNVSFQYNRNSALSLSNFNLTIPEFKTTAIVGDSGSGKTTLLKLLIRFYKPTYGNIMLGDMNINNISLRQWRDKCGVVFQDGTIFNDTILNNIVLDDEKINYEQLKYAVETANVAHEIESLPMGYNTKMGEQGRGLSGGQKQRILIARALYKNPDYLFLDEATNALDGLNEQKIISALEEAFKNKTVVVVAHRLSTIQKADQIVVMKEGRIIEVGDHHSLVKKNGYYQKLMNAQSNTLPTFTPKVEFEQ